MQANRPPVVASDGRPAFKISVSGFAELSENQKATSSAIHAQKVPDLIVRNEAGRHSMSTRVARLIVSDVCLSTRRFSAGTFVKMPSRY